MSNDVFFPPPSPLPSASRPAQVGAGAGLLTGTPCDEQRHSSPCQLRHRRTLLRGLYVADNTLHTSDTLPCCLGQEEFSQRSHYAFFTIFLLKHL